MITIHDYDWEELDKLLKYAASRIGKQPLIESLIYPHIIRGEGLINGSIDEIDLKLKAISEWNENLLEMGRYQGSGIGHDYKQGAFLQEFISRGGFKAWHEKQVREQEERRLKEKAEHEANLATIDAADSAKRAADASEDSATSAKWAWVIAGISAFISLVALIISILKK